MVNEKIFSRLSIAAVIDDSILCVHGGIGRIQDMGTVHTVATRCKRGAFIADIEEDPLLKAALMDILWSDPTDTEEECGIRPSPRGDSVVSFGSDVSERFLENSGLQMILRAHQCTSDGVDFSANGRVVTVFSATGYMNTHDNHGAVLEICPGEAGALILQAKIIHCEASSEPSPSVGAINGRIMCGVPPMSLPLDEADLMWQMSSDRPPSPLRVSRHPHSCKT
jgi:protein phosphatase/serine/threonine-protein phosphatase BSU1